MTDSLFSIEMLPALQGDAIWIEYGKANSVRRILIDGGPIGAYDALETKIATLPEADKRVELIVISHVDTDHIEGIIRLFAEKRTRWQFMPKDIWFNGWDHLDKSKMLGGREGDFLSALIRRRANEEWNVAFAGNAVVVEADEPLPVKELKDNMKLTLLSPNNDKLLDMAKKWKKDVAKHGLEPGDLEKAWEQLVKTTKYHVAEGVLGGTDDFGRHLKNQLKTDQSLANGTSIAFLAEFNGKSCLFLGDAHIETICQSIRRLIPNRQKRLQVDAVKLSHHGSMSNISKELLELIDARHFLVSTNGAIHEHPDKSAIETIIRCSVREPVFWFNYRSKYNIYWNKPEKDKQKKFTAHYPSEKIEGITVEL
jgi:beta-lactamase superfamily II metal-dependent hydrolase